METSNSIKADNQINKNVVIIIPSLNPDHILVAYIKELIAHGASEILVVNDGSDKTYDTIFDEIKAFPQCDVLRHEVNCGKGRSLKDAMTLYQENYMSKGYIGVITADADGQHTVKDVARVSSAMEANSNSVVLGEREFDKDVPFRSKFGNVCTSFLFHLLYRIKLHDTQTGLRGIPNCYISDFSTLKGERYEYEMNMLIACSRKKIPIQSVRIQTVYNDNNGSSHFRPIVDSFKIYKLLLGTFIIYTCVSLSSFIIDIGIFRILVALLASRFTNTYILISTVLARICSSIYNFFMNKNVVFKSDEKTTVTMVKYFSLCVVQMLVSAGLVSLLYRVLPFSETITKIVVDTCLFFASYWIQNNLIFKRKK